MTHDIDDHAIRVGDKETANAPRLVRQPVNDLNAKSNRFGMHFVNVRNLNGQIGVWRSRCGPAQQGNLSGRVVGGGKGHDPTQSIATWKPKNSV